MCTDSGFNMILSIMGWLPPKLVQAYLGGVPETTALHGPELHAKLGFLRERRVLGFSVLENLGAQKEPRSLDIPSRSRRSSSKKNSSKSGREGVKGKPRLPGIAAKLEASGGERKGGEEPLLLGLRAAPSGAASRHSPRWQKAALPCQRAARRDPLFRAADSVPSWRSRSTPDYTYNRS